ncbi:hypothetical protein [Mycolicibacterium pyrenivorans]|uniref:hypothetical protein n=1 Tax=Mycolicibacterium pyrenivorans TaxID=187102 RepID=UPI0021F2BFC0|nr:hypothetical protein [Mycolicibacterium pyrenivorans]MCV7155301.1 hypothetical protein [Mycolicibacterium pyrenivorans]
MGDPTAAAPTNGRNSQRRLVDFAGTVFFLLLQAAVFRATLFLAGGSVELTFYGGMALLLISLGLCIWRLARVRPAAIFALAGLALQLGLSGLAYLMAS